MTTRGLALGLLLAFGLALALRCPRLERRPFHNDEAVNAIKFGQLWNSGSFKYDPNEHHGPTLYYATLLAERLSRAPDFDDFTDARFRLMTVAFGVALLLTLGLTVDGLGRGGTGWAALFLAISPAMVFYSRYYIHEMLLVAFTALALGAGWRYWQSRRFGWALLAGLAVGLMDATKETFVLNMAAGAVAISLNWFWNRYLDAGQPEIKVRRFNWLHPLAACALWVVTALILFSSFFTNAAGPLDSVRTYLPWLHRAEGQSPHIHEWSFYLHRLLWFHAGNGPVWSEALLAALAVIGGWAGFSRRGLTNANASFVRFLTLYTVALAAAYTSIAYKTPWCLLGFWHGAILLAGVGVAVLWREGRKRPLRVTVALALLVGTGHLIWQAWQLGVPSAADRRNPYVYAQTSPDVRNLVEKVEALAQVDPRGHQMLIKVIAPEDDYWPLPWYLRRFKQVGWWGQMPADPFAPVMIVAASMHANLDEKKTHLMVGYTELRPGTFFELYVQSDLWKAYLEKGKS
jgi:uncharacterized protein (TIGR03663 family)